MSGSGQIVSEGGLGERASTRGSRRRYLDGPADCEVLAHWPGAWRELLTRWLRSAASRRRIESLLKGLDGPQLASARELLEALLLAGWISLDEAHQGGGVWQPRMLKWRDADALRETLGLPRIDQRRKAADEIAARQFLQPEAQTLHAALLTLPSALWSRRLDLVEAVQRWCSQMRCGSQRDFELLARGSTKSLSSAEWEWLRQTLDLDLLGISGHTPGLWLRGGFRLKLPGGLLDLAAANAPLALTPDTLGSAVAIEVPPREWLVVENRTSFERLARSAAPELAVLWVPGRPPRWWLRAVAHLLQLAPAPSRIACDPDPAGIAIACAVASLWDNRGAAWQPLGMDPQTLDALPALLPLNEWDRRLLDSLATQSLPAPLEALRVALLKRGMKGEQEGFL